MRACVCVYVFRNHSSSTNRWCDVSIPRQRLIPQQKGRGFDGVNSQPDSTCPIPSQGIIGKGASALALSIVTKQAKR